VSITAKLEGIKNLEASFEAAAAKASNGFTEEIKVTALEIQAEVLTQIQKQSSGEKVTRYRNGSAIKHTVSKPGDAPNTDTSSLVKSYERGISFENRGRGIIAKIGSNLPYAAHLEFGTKDKTLQARPHLLPAFRKILKAKNGKAVRIQNISKVLGKAAKG